MRGPYGFAAGRQERTHVHPTMIADFTSLRTLDSPLRVPPPAGELIR